MLPEMNIARPDVPLLREEAEAFLSWAQTFCKRMQRPLTNDELCSLFHAGLVRRVVMGLNKHTREPCGFAFVEFHQPHEAQQAIVLLNGASCDGRVVRVDADSGENIESDRKFGRGFTGRQWRDEYREEYDVGRGGEGRKKRNRSEAEWPAFSVPPQQHYFPPGAPMGHMFPPPSPHMAASAPFVAVPPPPPPPPPPAEASAAAAAAALDAAVAEEAAAYMWHRNVRARKQQHHNNAAAGAAGGGKGALPAAAAAGPPTASYSVYPSASQPAASYAAAAAADVYLHGSYLELVQQAQQQHPVDPYGAAGQGKAAGFMRSRGGGIGGRGRRRGGGRN